MCMNINYKIDEKESKKSINIIEHMRNYPCSEWIYIEWVLFILLLCGSIGVFFFWVGYSLIHYGTDNPAPLIFHIRSLIILILSLSGVLYITVNKDCYDD